MRRPSFACLAALVLVASTASAQPPPAVKPPAGAAPMATPLLPSDVEVSDPMLTPMPPAKHQLTNWRDVITQIKARSSDVIIARAEIDKARGAWRVALAAALPQINATGTAFYDLAAGPAGTATAPTNPRVKSLTGAITATVPAFNLKTWYDTDTADKNVKALNLAADDKERVVLGTTADAIVAVFTAERTAEVNRVNLKSTLQTLELTKRKQRLGSGTQLDVVQAAAAVSTSRATLVTGDEQLRKTREALGLALGYNDDWGVTPNISLDQIGDTLKQVCQPAKPEERTDVLYQKQNVLLAKRGVTSAYLVYAPTLNLSTTASASVDGLIGGGGGANAALIEQGIHPANVWSITALLTIPIWDGGARYGNARIARANEVEAKATLDITTRSAQLQVNQTYRNIEVSQTSREVAVQTRDLTKEQAHLQQVAFQAGTGTSFDLVTSQAQARQAELQLVVAEFAVIQAKLEAMLAAANCKF
jgi:multidrug efflux system outer membrane protein